MRWRGYEYQQRRPWIPDQVGDDSKRKEGNRRMPLPPLRPSLQRRGNDGRHEMARLQLQKEDKGNDEILHCVQDDR